MPTTAAARPPVLSRSRGTVVEAVTQVLVERPGASLGEVAQRVGVGRTTLHRLFPTREALLRAVALDALEQLGGVYAAAGLPLAFTPAVSTETSWASLERLVALLVPLGPRLTFLLRTRELDGDAAVAAQATALDRTLETALERARHAGLLAPHLPAAWLVASLYALVYVAWEQVEEGRLASLDAPRRVMDTWLGGVAGPR